MRTLTQVDSGIPASTQTKGVGNTMIDKIALVLVIIGALNWGSIGLFSFGIVAWMFGGQAAMVSRIIYTLVAIAGIWCISLLFKEREHREVID